jgi:maltose alpha-D-glucosyltransferase / alpha-amylase
MGKTRSFIETDPLWYKHGVIYQAHVRSFYDSDGNGVGDFAGFTEKLDYLQDLGVSAIWLLPFYPSPLKDDGYDIADYFSINPIYGTLADFKYFLREAHRRGLRVITELVINHTSDQHPWFQRSRRAKPGSTWRDFYVWSDTADRYKDARIIFKDFETSNWAWDPVANAYFWHRFYSHQPDLNFDNPHVHREIFRVLDFWLDMGVDGLRLDAIPYLYEREGTNCENLPETHAFLKKLRAHVDANYSDRMLLAEANQWPEDAVAYFGSGRGDECHVAFHFPLMPRLFMSVRMEDRFPIVDILDQTPAIPETSQWALFLRNHDELTLEMVTDEERDYMYRVYAHDPQARINLGIRRRLSPLLGNDRRRIELLNALMFSLPGTPVLYYGDEVGMGENTYLGDRNGVRTPMQWSSDRNAGFSKANPQALYLPLIVDPQYHYQTVNVEAQQGNPHSMLWWMKRLLALRRRWKAFGLGTMEFLHPENRKVLAYTRGYENDCVLVVANLSRFVQPVELDLSKFRGRVPVEIFGRTRFPPVGDAPFFLTLSPHAFFWFSMEEPGVGQQILPGPVAVEQLPEISVPERWESILTESKLRARLESVLQKYLPARRWFRGKAREMKSLDLLDRVAINSEGNKAFIAFLSCDFTQGDPETYVLPLAFAVGEAAEQIRRDTPQLAIARIALQKPGTDGILYDATANKAFSNDLLELVSRRRSIRSEKGELVASSTPALRQIREAPGGGLEPSLGRAEQSNTAVIYGERLLLKLFRRMEPGVNPDLEIGRFLTAKEFPNIAPVAGALEYRAPAGDLSTLGILFGFVPHARDAWEFTLDALGRYYERVQALSPEAPEPPFSDVPLVDLIKHEYPQEVPEMLGMYLESARSLAERTAEMHLALASDSTQKDFAPEPFTPHYQRSLYQSMRNLLVQNFQLLRKQAGKLDESAAGEARKLLELEPRIMQRFRAVADRRINAMRIRCHGDYHLGQVLHTGKDFIILDFEGEPARPLGERRIKRSPITDVAGMLRSFHYAAFTGLLHQMERGIVSPENRARFEGWARSWHLWVSVCFLRSYLRTLGDSNLLPQSEDELSLLLDAKLLEKAVYEVGYELNNRPDWLKIPVQGILDLVHPGGAK